MNFFLIQVILHLLTHKQQIDGTAMVNPTTPVLPNLVMHDLIIACLKKLPFSQCGYKSVQFISSWIDS